MVGGERSNRQAPEETALESRLLEEDPRLWTPAYSDYNCGRMTAQLAELKGGLRGHVEEETLEEAWSASLDFLHNVFDRYENPGLRQENTTFAFMVPSRTRRAVAGNSDPYKAEWHELYPILCHVDSGTAQRFLAGSPPFVIDWYGQDEDGKQGCMLFAPVFADMSSDLGRRGALRAGARIMNETLAFAKEMGISTVGLGAILPKMFMLFNRLGMHVNDHGMQLTTGHASTVWLMEEITKPFDRRGVIGAGAIGMAYITDVRQRLGYEEPIYVYDKAVGQNNAAARLHPSNITANDLGELLANCNTIVCAATDPIRLDASYDLTGRIVVDDSQPGCFDPDNVADRGGKLLWVIGTDPTYDGKSGEITCQKFTYGGSGPANKSEIWGCQAEAWAVHKATQNNLGSIGVRGEVTPADVHRLGSYLKHLGVEVAPLQARGQYL